MSKDPPILDAGQLTGRPRDIHDRTIAAGFRLVEVCNWPNLVRWRYGHPDRRRCFTDTSPEGVLLDTTADISGHVKI